MERYHTFLAISLVLAITLIALFGSPVTTGQLSLVVSNGYDSKTGQTLSVSGALSSLQGSDNIYYNVDPQSYLVLQFSDVSSASGAVKRARLVIEHKEDYSTKSSLALLSVGTGLSDPNTSFIWSSLKMPRRAKERTDSFDITKYVNSIERANNLELRIFNKNPSGSIEVDRAYVQLDFAETAQSLPSNQNPIASFTASPDSGSAPLTVTFDASSSSDPDGIIGTFAWNFGDSSSSFGKIVTHTYQNQGTYTATLKAYDNLGASSTISKTITVAAATPVATNGTCVDLDGDNIYTASYAYINNSPTSTTTQYDICKNGTNYQMVEGICSNNQPLGMPKSCPSGYSCQTIKTLNKMAVGACVAQNTTTVKYPYYINSYTDPSNVSAGQSVKISTYISSGSGGSLPPGAQPLSNIVNVYLDGALVKSCVDTGEILTYVCSYTATFNSVGNHTYYGTALISNNTTIRSPATGVNVLQVKQPTNETDITPPTVSVAHSPSTPYVGDKVTVTASASDNVAISNIDLYVLNTLTPAKSCATSPCEYSTVFSDTKIYVPYVAKVTDTSGNNASGWGTFRVTISPNQTALDTQPPNINVTHAVTTVADNPKPNLVITITAYVGDDRSGVGSMKFYYDDVLAFTCARGEPYYLTTACSYGRSYFNTSDFGSRHSYYVVTSDAAGHVVTTPKVSFTLTLGDTGGASAP